MFSNFSYLNYLLTLIKKRFRSSDVDSKFEYFQNDVISVCSDSKDKFWRNLFDERVSLKEYKKNCLKIKELVIFNRPLKHILGKTEFYSIEFSIPKGVFIPQKDTEILVDSIFRLSRRI